MNYARINKHDVANGPGVRVSLFVSGCTTHCKGCFNQETWDFDYGLRFSVSALEELEEAMKPEYISGLTILGGDPLEEKNIEMVDLICSYIRTAFPAKTIWIYTGRTYEWLLERAKQQDDYAYALLDILDLIDVLVDGPFIEEQKDITLQFKGSRNQRIIEVGKIEKGIQGH